MSKRSAALLVITAIAAGLIWWAGRPRMAAPEPNGPPPAAGPTDAPDTEAAPPLELAPAVATPSGALPPPQAPKAAPLPPSDRRDLQNPLAPASFPLGPSPRPAEADPTAAADLDKISLMIRDYRTIAGENPVGTNAEIMKAIMGENPRGAKIGPPEGMSLNASGELIDHWGSPIFFHQLSRDLMEIHSAGPDLRMGTEDDLILK